MEKLESSNKDDFNNIKKQPRNTTFIPSPSKCLCSRPKTNILCNNCGNVMYGRVRYACSLHLMVTFLCDIDKCDRCFSNYLMLSEILDPTHIY